MIELWIDGRECDIAEIPTIPINFDAENLIKVEGARVGRSIELELPATPLNDAVFGASRDLYAAARFNIEHHTAFVKKDGVTIFEGVVYLCATTVKQGLSGGYLIRIVEGGADWVEAVIKRDIKELNIPFSASLTLLTISDSWEENQSVRFLPVYRGGNTYGYSSDAALPIERVMLTDDYHPFISVADMVKAMFADLGYTLHSNFFDSEFGRSLYMSGDYARSDASSAKERCDFFARRSTPTTATADFSGRVYASTAFATHTVGPIVDTADAEAFDSEGVQMIETFNTFNAFSKNSAGNICFTPKSSVKAGFMLHLEYTTDYKILSRKRFVGFDKVEGLSGVRVEFQLANTCKDHRKDFATNQQYRLIVFNHTEGREYSFSGMMPDGTIYPIKQWATRSTLVNFPSELPTSLQLYYREDSGAIWRLYSGDWALYDGYIEEEGRIDVSMDLRLPPQDISAGESYILDKIWFGGAEQGMKLTVGIGTTLKPYFTMVPGYGSVLSFEDIAPRQVSQATLLSAVGEMFNLAFYTEEKSKTVYIEPLEALYDDEVVDWSGRIDHTNGMVISDRGLDTPQNITFAYIEADKASHKFNNDNETTLGRYEFHNPLYGTKESAQMVGNRLFTTTLNATDIVASAPSASLLQVGDVGAEESGIDSGFTPRIVCYKGMRTLPNGECWIATERLEAYPYASFWDSEEVNLCFEDRGGLQGLHTYHKERLSRLRNSQTIALDLHLTTAETAHLLTGEGPKPSLRKKFRFSIQGESSLFRLSKVERWDTEKSVVHCTFERELND